MIFNFFRRKKSEDSPETPIENDLNIVDTSNTQEDVFSKFSDTLSEISSIVRNMEQRSRDILEKVESLEERVNIHEKNIEELKNTTERMFMLYDAISRSYNPFVEEEKVVTTPKVEEVEKKETSGKKLPLDKIKEDPMFVAIIMGWLNYLVTKSSLEEAEKAIEYYESIGWITENVKIELLKYLQGFSSVHCEKQKLLPEDHLVSLYIITKLKDGLDKGIVKFSELYKELINKGIIKPMQR